MLAANLFCTVFIAIACALTAYAMGAGWALIIASYTCSGTVSFVAMALIKTIWSPQSMDELSIQKEVEFASRYVKHNAAGNHSAQTHSTNA